jgi:hypothetical protein
MTRAERAAVRFVRDLIPRQALEVIGGYRDPAYERVLAACRREMGLPASDPSVAAKRLIAAFPHDQRHALTQILYQVFDVEFERLRVRERAAFRVGEVVGRSQAGALRHKAGTR